MFENRISGFFDPPEPSDGDQLLEGATSIGFYELVTDESGQYFVTFSMTGRLPVAGAVESFDVMARLIKRVNRQRAQAGEVRIEPSARPCYGSQQEGGAK